MKETIIDVSIPWWLYVIVGMWLIIIGSVLVAYFQFANYLRKETLRWLGKPHWEENRDLAFWTFVAAAFVLAAIAWFVVGWRQQVR